MENLGYVSSEGGPLLIADSAIAQNWLGATFDTQDDYQRACEIFDAEPEVQGKLLTIANGMGLIWDMGGAGTSDIFLRDSTHLVIVRAWLDDPDDEAIVSTFAHTPLREHKKLGSLNIKTGIVAILWAPESGQTIEPTDISINAAPINNLGIDGSGLLVKLPIGEYQCLSDEFTTEHGDARRCHLVKQT